MRSRARSSSGRNGLISFSVKDCRANGGGAVGNGCVGHACSPGMSDFGTGRSSIGQIGSPVSRLNTKRKPCLVAWATTSTAWPLRLIVRSLGAGARS